MRLPSGSIKRIFLYAIGAGIALGLVCYGVLNLAWPIGPPFTLLISLGMGAMLGICLFLASCYALRFAAYDLRHTASDLTGQPLHTFAPRPGEDEFAVLRSTFERALAFLPDSRLHSILAQAIAASPADISQRFGAAITRFSQDVPLRGAVLCTYTAEGVAFLPISTWGLPLFTDMPLLLADEGPLRRVAREERDVMLSGAEAKSVLHLLGLDESPLPVLCLPLRVAHTLRGLLLLISAEQEVVWSAQRRDPARGLASQLTMALGEEQLRQQLAQEQRNSGALIELGMTLTTALPFEAALERMLRGAAALTQSTYGTLLLLDAHEDVRYRIALSKGTLVPLQLVARSVLRGGLAGWALRERRPDIIADTQRDSRWLPFPGLDGMRSALVVPLTYGERTLGILTLAHNEPHHYNERMLQVTSALAAQVVHLVIHEQHLEADQREQQKERDQQRTYEMLLPHVPQTVLDDLVHDGSLAELALPRNVQAVVVAIGLRNIASASEQLAPEVLLNDVMQPFARIVTDAVREYGGYLDQCHGDGALAVFGYPQPAVDAAEHALRVAQQVQTLLNDLRHRWRTVLRCNIVFTIGVAAGSIVTGRGSDDPLQGRYLVVGSAVNQAQRLQALGRPGEILCNAAINAAVHSEGVLDGRMTLEALEPLPIGEGDEQLYRFTSAI